MKIFLYIAFFSTLWSFNSFISQAIKRPEKLRIEGVGKTEAIEDSVMQSKRGEDIERSINIQHIKDCAEQGMTSFNMDSLPDQKKFLENSIVDNSLGEVPVNGYNDWYLKANERERFSCHQWEESEDYFLFTLLQKDESCCLSMYLCVADTVGNLLAIRRLGLRGADGGWIENDWGEKVDFGKFKISHNSFYSEEKFENGIELGVSKEHKYTELLISFENETFIIDTLVSIKNDTLIIRK